MRMKIYLLEIYNRLLVSLFTILTNFIIFYSYKEQVIYMLGQHQPNLFPYFISTGLTEIFLIFIKLSAFLAFYFSYPIILIQTGFFLVPALYKYEYKIIRNYLLLSLSLYFLTTIATYKYFLPYCWKFFSSFQMNASENLVSIHLETRISDYLSFFFDIFVSLNIVLHLLLVFLIFLHKFTLDSIVAYRKIIYLILFMFATVLTPPDIFSQILMGILFILAFELFLFSLFFSKERQMYLNTNKKTSKIHE